MRCMNRYELVLLGSTVPHSFLPWPLDYSDRWTYHHFDSCICSWLIIVSSQGDWIFSWRVWVWRQLHEKKLLDSPAGWVWNPWEGTMARFHLRWLCCHRRQSRAQFCWAVLRICFVCKAQSGPMAMKIIWATKRSVPLVSLGTKRPGRLKHGSSWSQLYSFMKGSFSGPLLCNAQTHTGSSLLSIASRNAQRQHWIHRKLFLCMWSIWFIFSSIQMAILTDSYFNNFFLASPNYISFLFVDVPEYEMPNGLENSTKEEEKDGSHRNVSPPVTLLPSRTDPRTLFTLPWKRWWRCLFASLLIFMCL